MKTKIRTKGIKLTDSMKFSVESSLGQLEKYSFNINHMDVIINDNGKKSSTKFEVEYLIKVDYSKNIIVVKHHHEDFNKLVSELTIKAEKIMRRLHDKKVDKRKSSKEVMFEKVREMDAVE